LVVRWPSLIPLIPVQSGRVGAALIRLDSPARVSQLIVGPLRDKKITSLVVQPHASRLPGLISPSGLSASRQQQKTPVHPPLVMPIEPGRSAPAVAALRSRIFSLTKSLLPRVISARIARIDLGKRIYIPRLEARRTPSFETAPILSRASSIVTLPQIWRSDGRAANVEVLPINVVRELRPSRIDPVLLLLVSATRRGPVRPQPQRVSEAVHAPLATPLRYPSAIEAFRSSKMLQALSPAVRGDTTARFVKELDQIRTARDQLADRVTTMAPQVEIVPASDTPMSLLKENARPFAVENDPSAVDGEMLVRRLRTERIYLVGDQGIVLPLDRAVLAGAELEWLKRHQLDARNIQRDQQDEIERVTDHVHRHLEAFRNEKLEVDKDFAAAWTAFSAAPAIQAVIKKAGEGRSTGRPPARTLDAPPKMQVNQSEASEIQNSQTREFPSKRAIGIDEGATTIAYAQAAAAAKLAHQKS